MNKNLFTLNKYNFFLPYYTFLYKESKEKEDTILYHSENIVYCIDLLTKKNSYKIFVYRKAFQFSEFFL